MRILQVIYELNPGGAERFVVDLSNELAKSGEEVFLCMLLGENQGPNITFNKHFLNANVHYVNLGTRSGFRISTFIKVHRMLNSIKPDVINFHLNVIPYFFFKALFNKKTKMFHTLHNIAEATVGNIQKPLNKFFYKTNRIMPITISKQCNESYKNFFKLTNSVCIKNGRSKIQPSKKFEIVKDEISSYRSSNSDLIFIHIASCSKIKNQELLIKSFNSLEKEGINFTLLIIGNGYNSQEGMRLKQMACTRIKFLGVKENVGDYLLVSDAFCLTSLYEGLPISLLEAITCGCVPICTKVGGIPDVIEEAKTGYLSKEITLKSYLSALRKYIMNPNLISKQSLIEHFKLNFSIEKCSAEYLSIYHQMYYTDKLKMENL